MVPSSPEIHGRLHRYVTMSIAGQWRTIYFLYTPIPELKWKFVFLATFLFEAVLHILADRITINTNYFLTHQWKLQSISNGILTADSETLLEWFCFLYRCRTCQSHYFCCQFPPGSDLHILDPWHLPSFSESLNIHLGDRLATNLLQTYQLHCILITLQPILPPVRTLFHSPNSSFSAIFPPMMKLSVKVPLKCLPDP